MQHQWVCIIILYIAYARSQNVQVSPSLSDLFLTPNNLAPDSSAFLASCKSELPVDSEGLGISSLKSRQLSDSELLHTLFNTWDLEDPQNLDDPWGSGSVGEPNWLSDLTDPEVFAFNENPPQNDRSSPDVCSMEPPTEGNGGWESPWIPIDPGQPDHDCLDDDWEKFCCPLGIVPLAGTGGCVPCKEHHIQPSPTWRYFDITDGINTVDRGRQECTNLFNIYCCYPEQEDVSYHSAAATLN